MSQSQALSNGELQPQPMFSEENEKRRQIHSDCSPGTSLHLVGISRVGNSRDGSCRQAMTLPAVTSLPLTGLTAAESTATFCTVRENSLVFKRNSILCSCFRAAAESVLLYQCAKRRKK